MCIWNNKGFFSPYYPACKKVLIVLYMLDIEQAPVKEEKVEEPPKVEEEPKQQEIVDKKQELDYSAFDNIISSLKK